MAGKTRRNFGRLERLPSGRWRAGYVGPDNQLYRPESTFDGKADAAAWLSARRAEIQMGIWAPEAVAKAKSQGALEFGAYAERWMAARTLKPRTRSHYANILKTHIYPTFGHLPLRSITADDVHAWYATVAIGKPTMKSHAYALLRTILGGAVQDRALEFNPCHIRGAGNAKRVHKTEAATLPELEALVTAMPDRYQAMVLLAAWCAMRFGELAELRRGDIDLKRGKVKIRRAVVKVDGQMIVGTPKSDAGIRDVAIPPHLMPAILGHLADHTGAGKDALLFPAASGGHLAPSTLYKVYYPARESAGRPDLRFHDLRHTGAVLAAQTGATLANLMARLGHSTAGAAMRYQHAAEDSDAEIARGLSAMVEGV